MPATDALHPEQLQMFMTAGEFMGKLRRTADRPIYPVEEVMAQKLEESKTEGRWYPGSGRGVHKSVEEQGVQEPVQLIHSVLGPMMGGGHHRVAAAAEIEERTGKPQWLSVIHTEGGARSATPVGDLHSRIEAVREGKRYAETNLKRPQRQQ